MKEPTVHNVLFLLQWTLRDGGNYEEQTLDVRHNLLNVAFELL